MLPEDGLPNPLSESGAWLPSTEQNAPPMPLSCSPSICPWPKPQTNRFISTQKYRAQAISERSGWLNFMAATLPLKRQRDEARRALLQNVADYVGWPGLVDCAPASLLLFKACYAVAESSRRFTGCTVDEYVIHPPQSADRYGPVGPGQPAGRL